MQGRIFYKNRFFSRINIKGYSFRAEYSHCFRIGQSFVIWMKSIIKPPLDRPNYEYIKKDGFWFFSIHEDRLQNKTIEKLIIKDIL